MLSAEFLPMRFRTLRMMTTETVSCPVAETDRRVASSHGAFPTSRRLLSPGNMQHKTRMHFNS